MVVSICFIAVTSSISRRPANSAIVWWAGRAWVYRRLSDTNFSRHAIPTDMPAEKGTGYIVPASMFAPREEIVVAASQLLLSEEFRAQIQVEGDDD